MREVEVRALYLQYDEGCITYAEFITKCLSYVTEKDRADYNDIYEKDCPF